MAPSMASAGVAGLHIYMDGLTTCTERERVCANTLKPVLTPFEDTLHTAKMQECNVIRICRIRMTNLYDREDHTNFANVCQTTASHRNNTLVCTRDPVVASVAGNVHRRLVCASCASFPNIIQVLITAFTVVLPGCSTTLTLSVNSRSATCLSHLRKISLPLW